MKHRVAPRLAQGLFSCLIVWSCSGPEDDDPAVSPTSSSTSTDATTVTASSSSGTTPVVTSSASTSSVTTTSGQTTSTSSSNPSTSSASTTSNVTSSNNDTSGSTGSGGVPSFAEVRTILQYSCVLVSCHTPLYNLPNMSDWDSEAALHERLTTYQVKHCSDAMLVKPGEPENSAILKVVTHGCGDFIMPPLCEDPCLDPEYYASLEAWIKAGAPAQ